MTRNFHSIALLSLVLFAFTACRAEYQESYDDDNAGAHADENHEGNDGHDGGDGKEGGGEHADGNESEHTGRGEHGDETVGDEKPEKAETLAPVGASKIETLAKELGIQYSDDRAAFVDRVKAEINKLEKKALETEAGYAAAAGSRRKPTAETQAAVKASFEKEKVRAKKLFALLTALEAEKN